MLSALRGLLLLGLLATPLVVVLNLLGGPDLLRLVAAPSESLVTAGAQASPTAPARADPGPVPSRLLQATRPAVAATAAPSTPTPNAHPALPPTPTPLPAPRRVADDPPPAVTAKHVAILDEGSGALLHGVEPHARVAPASTTKILTGLLALEREPDLDRVVPITVNASELLVRDGSQVMGLEPGERLKLRTLLHGLMLWSGNDAAEQLALTLAGSRETFVGWMNQRVAALGLRDTHFVTPSGMDAPGHHSSAHDMAQLARHAMRNEAFRALVATRFYEADGYPIPNLNGFLASYPDADGVKNGFTDEAGKTIVASATRDGRRVYVSLMNSQNLVGDATALFDWVWRTFAW